ncbi:MAG: hypothetical protein AUG96_01800 [Chloroflexi bacterium 13_1_20CM_4_66_15]|nr:MAG: hypothetical protein AUG96_01800 [Chloroflexi bacterium 13_1_20CM_4_66_15]
MVMTDEMRRMIRGAVGGAFLGGLSGSVAGFIGTLIVGLEPLVFLACGVYAGIAYGGIVGALMGARDEQSESEPVSAGIPRRGLVLATAVARSRAN